jgi:ribulose-5-phosphate 4-epimerase/fuculose-1-phosphate aldolase
MHVHSTYATVLASLADSRLPPIDQSSAIFYNRQVIDEDYGGLALEEEGTRCARLFQDPSVRTMIMGNHGVLFIGETVAETFMRMYYFERAARTYIIALSTGRPLREMHHEVAELTARQQEGDAQAEADFLAGLRAVLDVEEPDYAA